jgi:N-acetylglutamate synthase-like GNAT family acetyltransferase
VEIRVATREDLPEVDKLQKANSHALGFLHRATLEGKIALGEMLVAREASGAFAGYVIGSDTYHKREELGVVYQMAVVKRLRRTTVAATLLKGLFASWPYGTRLCCAWCAQDLSANRFWEAMGFVPLAYRAGSASKERVHIFWQKRIVEEDVRTPWWYPSVTGNGSIREDRLVLPIPEGQHWSETRPTVLPGTENKGTGDDEICRANDAPAGDETEKEEENDWLPEGVEEREGKFYSGRKQLMTAAMIRERLGIGNREMFMVPKDVKLVQAMPVRPEPKKKPKRKAKPPVKHDARLAEAVRDLRDRWLEHVNADGRMLIARGKYAVGRAKGLAGPAAEENGRLVLPWPAIQRAAEKEAA